MDQHVLPEADPRKKGYTEKRSIKKVSFRQNENAKLNQIAI